MAWIREIGRFILVILLQVMLFNHLHIGSWGMPMMYIIFLLNLPIRVPRWAEMLLGFTIGLIMDIWTSSLGIHIAACVALSFLRPILLNMSTQDIERIKDHVSSKTVGTGVYIKMAILLTFIHHLIVFSLETWNMHHWWIVIVQTVISSILTLIIILGYDRIRR